jgi:hypothetical protein
VPVTGTPDNTAGPETVRRSGTQRHAQTLCREVEPGHERVGGEAGHHRLRRQAELLQGAGYRGGRGAWRTWTPRSTRPVPIRSGVMSPVRNTSNGGPSSRVHEDPPAPHARSMRNRASGPGTRVSSTTMLVPARSTGPPPAPAIVPASSRTDQSPPRQLKHACGIAHWRADAQGAHLQIGQHHLKGRTGSAPGRLRSAKSTPLKRGRIQALGHPAASIGEGIDRPEGKDGDKVGLRHGGIERNGKPVGLRRDVALRHAASGLRRMVACPSSMLSSGIRVSRMSSEAPSMLRGVS